MTVKELQQCQLYNLGQSAEEIFIVPIRDPKWEWKDLPDVVQFAQRIVFLDCFSGNQTDDKIEVYYNACLYATRDVQSFIQHATTNYIIEYLYYENGILHKCTAISHNGDDGHLPGIDIDFKEFVDCFLGNLDIFYIYVK